jgi:hypothetical protein
MTTSVLIARPLVQWRSIALAVLAIGAHLVIGLIVLALRTARVIVSLATDLAIHAEQQLVRRTDRPAVSHVGIGAMTAALVREFRLGYREPTR